MEVMNEVVNTYLVPAFFVLVSALITYVANYIRVLYNERCTNELVKRIVETSVTFVEQKFSDAKGSEKYDEALKRIESLLNEYGITVPHEELDIMIESSVYLLTTSVKDDKKTIKK